MSKDKPSDDSPFRPTGGVAKKPPPLDADATTPGVSEDMLGGTLREDAPGKRAPPPSPSDAGRSTIPIEKRKPGRQPPGKSKGEPTAAKPVQPAAAKPIQPTAAKPIQPAAAKPIQPTAAKPIQPTAAKSIQPAGADSAQLRTLADLSSRLDQQLNATLDAVGEVRQGIEESEGHREQLLDEAKSVNQSYKQLVEKMMAERDALSRELSHVRSKYATDARQQAQAFTDLQRDLEKERRENERKLREAEDQVERQRQRITELESQLSEALASRDRIAARVREVETNLEQSILPLREELDQTRQREGQLRTQLEGARKEIEALKLLAKGPPTRG